MSNRGHPSSNPEDNRYSLPHRGRSSLGNGGNHPQFGYNPEAAAGAYRYPPLHGHSTHDHSKFSDSYLQNSLGYQSAPLNDPNPYKDEIEHERNRNESPEDSEEDKVYSFIPKIGHKCKIPICLIAEKESVKEDVDHVSGALHWNNNSMKYTLNFGPS